MAELTTINQTDWIAYAAIHSHANATTQSIPTGATYTKIVNFMDNDASRNCTPDAVNNKIIANSAGIYSIDGSFSFTCASNNINAFISLFKNGVEVEAIHLTRKIGTANDVGNAGFSGLLQLADGDEIDVRMRHLQPGPIVFTFSYMNINITKIDKV